MQAEGLAYAEPRALSRSNTLLLRTHLGTSVHLRMLSSMDSRSGLRRQLPSQLREVVLAVVLAMTQMFPLSSPRSHRPHRTLLTT